MVATPTLDRLRAAIATQSTGRPRPKAQSTPRDLPPIDRILHGEWWHTADGPVFVRDEWFPLDHARGAFTLGEALAADRNGLALLLRAEDAPPPFRCAFFDTETTGLSGGTGAYVVLAGLGSFEKATPDTPLAFRLRQYFLAGPEYERAMLQMLADDLSRFEAIVTYNGRSFDVPCIESRLTLARLDSPCGRLVHFDLLHGVRALYGHRMPGCRLADAERRLLRIERPDDIPGHLIPALYRDYLLADRALPLRGVLRHNAEDVISLVGILTSLAELLASDNLNPDDAVAVARWCERASDRDRAMRLYTDALPWLEGCGEWDWAAWRHSLLMRRSGKQSEAATLWKRLWSAGHKPAGLELAKYFEHCAQELRMANDVVESLLRDATEYEHDRLSHRLLRIQRKLSAS
jgi:uncharacterized protein YprB with RNaseH-like and TPR domain